MDNPDALIYIASKNAMEKYFHDEGIPVKCLPDLVPNDGDVLEGARHFLRAVRRVLATRQPVEQYQPRGAGQGALAR